VDGQTMKIIKPSIYSEMVWEQKLQRAKRDGGSIEWIVMRNRLSNIDAKNKRFMTQVTTDLSRRIGFRVAPGFSERVIFREMFLQGLTVLDIMEASGNASLSMSHVAARQEVRDLLKTLNIKLINDRIASKAKSEAEEGKEAPAPQATTTAPQATTTASQDTTPAAPQAATASVPQEAASPKLTTETAPPSALAAPATALPAAPVADAPVKKTEPMLSSVEAAKEIVAKAIEAANKAVAKSADEKTAEAKDKDAQQSETKPVAELAS
jgi:hypothetical protein